MYLYHITVCKHQAAPEAHACIRVCANHQTSWPAARCSMQGMGRRSGRLEAGSRGSFWVWLKAMEMGMEWDVLCSAAIWRMSA